MAKFRREKLLGYLESHGTIRSDLPYELDFAMRTCEQFKIEPCVVYLFCVAGMFGDAVEKALGFDVDLAKKCALMMEEAEANFAWLEGMEDPAATSYIRQKLDEKAKKAIWLKIGKILVFFFPKLSAKFNAENIFF